MPQKRTKLTRTESIAQRLIDQVDLLLGKLEAHDRQLHQMTLERDRWRAHAEANYRVLVEYQQALDSAGVLTPKPLK